MIHTYRATVALTHPVGAPWAQRQAYVHVEVPPGSVTSYGVTTAYAMLRSWPGVVEVLSIERI